MQMSDIHSKYAKAVNWTMM